MVFKASKKRERKPADRVGKGTPITPSYALELWYSNQIQAMTSAMLEDYKSELERAFNQSDMVRFYATDSASGFMTSLMNRLKLKWQRIFSSFATRAAKEFVARVDEQCTSATFASLSVAGIVAPRAEYNELIQNTLQGAEEWNTTLVTNISADMHEKINNAVMASLTSPNPEEQGTSGIQNALRETGEFSEKRAKFIAKDQTSKLYAALSDQRMEQNGVEEFDWLHSGGGKEPRTCHARMNGMTFKINDPRLWEVGGELGLKKGDLGPPGWAIGCKCRKRPRV